MPIIYQHIPLSIYYIMLYHNYIFNILQLLEGVTSSYLSSFNKIHTYFELKIVHILLYYILLDLPITQTIYRCNVLITVILNIFGKLLIFYTLRLRRSSKILLINDH